MNTVSIVLQTLTGLGFLASGLGKMSGAQRLLAEFAEMRLGRAARWSIGVSEILGGAGMLLALLQPFLVFFVAALLLLIVLGTMAVKLARRSRQGVAALAMLAVGAVASAIAQPLGLRVLALPKADVLPAEPVREARLMKAYDEGLWFESVKAGPDGTVYLAGNKGENYATGDKSQVQAQVIARTPDGSERVFFALPKGATAGVIAFGADGQMYMTGQGAALGIWRFTGEGEASLFAKLPRGAWPNGMTVGPNGQLYVADSLMGVIWRVDPQSGAVSRAVQSDALRRRPLIALAPGANGIHFFGRDLYVTVSDAAKVLKFQLGADGQLGAPTVFAHGIPGDDFAIDGQGSLYITTHPFNTIVRVRQNGERSVVADSSHGIIGATDAAFGVLPGDQDTLYVATDGGAFSGDLRARGTLVALKISTTP